MPTIHIYDWLDMPAINDAEKDAKYWLDTFVSPSFQSLPEDRKRWLDHYRVTVEWKGKRYTCAGASRMGDVWLKTEGSSNFYDHRVNVESLSNWKRITLPTTTS